MNILLIGPSVTLAKYDNSEFHQIWTIGPNEANRETTLGNYQS